MTAKDEAINEVINEDKDQQGKIHATWRLMENGAINSDDEVTRQSEEATMRLS